MDEVKKWLTPNVMDALPAREEEAEAQVKAAGEQLNPEWEEILMGWPIGWTDPTKPCSGVWPGFPMGQGAKQFAYEPPRTIPKGSMPGRTKRVEMCGNGVVPQQAEAGFYELLSGAL